MSFKDYNYRRPRTNIIQLQFFFPYKHHNTIIQRKNNSLKRKFLLHNAI